MIRPTRRALLGFTAGFPLAVLPIIVSPSLWTFWLVSMLGLLLFLGFDALLALSTRQLELDIATPEILYVGREDAASVEVRIPAGRTPRFTWFLETNPVLAENEAIDTRGGAALSFPLRPLRRGEAEIRALWVRVRGPLGLTERSQRIPLDRTIPVTPDLRSVREQALRFFTNRQYLIGQKIQRYLGEGSEFESLKEYQPGLDPRGLDWKATARHRKLLVREFQAERNHPVILAIDSGHLMREPLDGIPKLDHAINAALLLAYVALKSGDQVGLLHFDERVHEATLPKKGLQSFHSLQERCARIAYSDRETNFTLSVAQLSQKVRRRSLVVFFTDFVDSITADLMLENLRRIGSRHLLLFVGLKDPSLVEVRDTPPESALAVHRSVVAADLLRERSAVFRTLKRRGIQCLDATPAELSTSLVSRYLRIRQREMV